MHWIGYTETALTDGDTTNPIIIDGQSVTAIPGDVTAILGSGGEGNSDKEFVFSGTKWQEYGSTGSLKALAFKDTATGSTISSGSNAPSAVTFQGTTNGDFVTGYNNDGVAPSFTEGQFDAGQLPQFTEGAFDPGQLPSFVEGQFNPGQLPSFTEGGFDAGQLPSFTEGAFSAGSLPSFSEGQFSPAEIQNGFYTAGVAATYNHSGFNGGSLGSATKGAFTTEGVTVSVDDTQEAMIIASANTGQAVTEQGTFTPAAYGTDTFDGGRPTVVDVTKFYGGSKDPDQFRAGTLPSKEADVFDAGILPSKDADTFAAGTLPSKNADTWNAGQLPSKEVDTFDAGQLPSKEADTFSAGSVATLATSSAVTDMGVGTAAAQTFTGDTISVTVS